MKRITQRQIVFYMLMRWHKFQPGDFIPVWQFSAQEITMDEHDRVVFLSYAGHVRIGELYRENPGLVDRNDIIGKSGARYHGFRINKDATPAHILDPLAKKFYDETFAGTGFALKDRSQTAMF